MSQAPDTLPQTTQGSGARRLLTRLALALVRFYQRRLSPLKPPTCRFQPTCSEYARQALIKYGAAKGSALALRRISRCHPFHPGGYDPLR